MQEVPLLCWRLQCLTIEGDIRQLAFPSLAAKFRNLFTLQGLSSTIKVFALAPLVHATTCMQPLFLFAATAGTPLDFPHTCSSSFLLKALHPRLLRPCDHPSGAGERGVQGAGQRCQQGHPAPEHGGAAQGACGNLQAPSRHCRRAVHPRRGRSRLLLLPAPAGLQGQGRCCCQLSWGRSVCWRLGSALVAHWRLMAAQQQWLGSQVAGLMGRCMEASAAAAYSRSCVALLNARHRWR